MPAKIIPFTAADISVAKQHLRQDVRLGKLIDTLPPPQPGGRLDPFHVLINAILNQQISRRAAAAIEQRLVQLVGTPFRPERVRVAQLQAMRALGMSASKVACAQACAADACAEEFSERSCRSYSDAQVAARVMAIKGVGPWTAQIVLLFGLGRLDILPDGDGGIQRAAARLFNSRSLVTARTRLVREARKWSPYRSVAAWYLWRSLD